MPFKQKVLVIIVVIIVAAAIGFVFIKNRVMKDLSKITDEEIINLLEKNNDGLEYIEKNKDFKIEVKTLLTKENIIEGQEGENFKEVYQGLILENNRYLKVDLINGTGDRGLIAVLDLKTQGVPRVFGLLLLKGDVKKE